MKLPLLLFTFLVAVALRSPGSDTIGIRIITEQSPSEKIIVGYTEKMTPIGEMSPEITILDRLTEGSHELDLSHVPKETELLYFCCKGYAPQWIRIKEGDRRVSEIEVHLFLKRYVTIRYADDPGGPGFSLTKGEELVLTQYTLPGGDGAWELVQGKTPSDPGTDVWIHYWQIGSARWGAIESNKGFDDMTKAPTGDRDKYVGKDYLLRKGSSFFMKNTQGYAKIKVMTISTNRPQDIKILEFSPKFKNDVAPAQ